MENNYCCCCQLRQYHCCPPGWRETDCHCNNHVHGLRGKDLQIELKNLEQKIEENSKLILNLKSKIRETEKETKETEIRREQINEFIQSDRSKSHNITF